MNVQKHYPIKMQSQTKCGDCGLMIVFGAQIEVLSAALGCLIAVKKVRFRPGGYGERKLGVLGVMGNVGLLAGKGDLSGMVGCRQGHERLRFV